MTFISVLAVIFAIGLASYVAGRHRAILGRAQGQSYHSLPNYYGIWAAILSLLPAILVLVLWSLLDNLVFHQWVRAFYPAELLSSDSIQNAVTLAKIENIVDGIRFGDPEPWIIKAGEAWTVWQAESDLLKSMISITLALVGGTIGVIQVNKSFRSRNAVEGVMMFGLIASSTVAIFTTIAIVLSVLFETIRFFQLVPPTDFLFGLEWNPQFEGAERAGSGGGTATYGMVPMFMGTLLISAIALFVSVPVGLLSAVYLSEYASNRTRSIVKPLLEILAGVPTVVYGFFAALTVAPFVKSAGEAIGLTVASESALAAGLVMGVMIIPFVSSLSDDVINAVPQSLRDASYGLGSTPSETTRMVVLPAALPGIVAAVILAVSRAIGETMIVVMAAGLAANLSFNPLDAVTTVTSQIVTILVGDQEFESAKTLSAFALAMMLIILTLGLNYFALQVVKKYREQYD